MTAAHTKGPSPASSGEGHIAFLDPLRAVAILLVMAYHALGASYGLEQLHWRRFLRDFADTPPCFLPFLPFTFGWLGVAIFFAVSGFCIHLSYEKAKAKSFKVFFVRRFFRIFPPYCVALCAFVFFFGAAALHTEGISDAVQFFSHLLLVHNFDVRLHYGINPSFWSIATEVQLYLIYPLLLLISKRFGWNAALWGTGVLEVSLRIAASACPLPYWIIGSPFYYWFSWAIGAKLADDHLNGRPLFLTQCPLWVWPAMTLLANFFRPFANFPFLFTALATAKCISHFLSRPALPASQPRGLQALLAQVGVISYSVYLLHQPLLNFAINHLRQETAAHPLPPVLLFGCSLLFCGLILAASGVFFRLVENPSIQVGKWLCKKISAQGTCIDPGKHANLTGISSRGELK